MDKKENMYIKEITFDEDNGEILSMIAENKNGAGIDYKKPNNEREIDRTKEEENDINKNDIFVNIVSDGKIEIFCNDKVVKFEHLYKRVQKKLLEMKEKQKENFKTGPLSNNIKRPIIKKEYASEYFIGKKLN